MKYQKGAFTLVPNTDRLRGLPASVQVVYLWLSSYADKRGECFPSRLTLAKDTGLSERTIDAALVVLEGQELLTKETRKDPKNPGKNLTNYYQLTLVEEVEGVQELPQGGATIAPGVGQPLRTELYQYRTIKKENASSSKMRPLKYEITPDSPTKVKKKTDASAMLLRERLYGMLLKEHGVRPQPHAGDYQRVLAALKVMRADQVVDLVEDAIQDGKKRTIREMLTARSIDIYLQDA